MILRHHQKAFTLLEMLISIAIFALMSAMAYGGLSQLIRSSQQITMSNETLSELQFSLSSIEKDLLQLSNRKIRDEFGDEQPALKLAQDKLTFSRLGWVNFIGAQRSHIQRVEYDLKNDQLIRRYWLSLDQTVEQKPIESVLLHNVKNLSFKIIDAQGELHLSWPNTTNLKASPASAKAVEMTIELTQWGEITKLIELVDAVN